MKKLILPPLLSLISLTVFARQQQEIIDPETSKQMITTIKDIEIKGMLEKTGEFKKCREDNKFDASKVSDSTHRDAQIQKAEKCIQDALGKGKVNEERLKKLSENLNLQNYGLVQSNSVSEIQKYLSDKMYESMTGVNRKEADRKKFFESLKFKNKKHIDQRLFITMYKAQLSKNALFEISRYCFEDFRLVSRTSLQQDTFGEHWKGQLSSPMTVTSVTDTGEPKFGSFSDPKDKSKVYEDILKNMNIDPNLSADDLGKFFMECGKMMGLLCEKFKTDNSVTDNKSDVAAVQTKGAASCLARNRLIEIKKALANSDLVEKEFDTMTSSQLQDALLRAEKVKHFGENESLDDLTNYTSTDVMEGGTPNSAALEQAEKKCLANPDEGCEGFITDGEVLDKAKHQVEQEMVIKREVELARVRELKTKGEQALKDYLQENGFFNILKKLENDPKLNIEEEVRLEFEARKVATLSEINNKIGSRQSKKVNGKTVVDADHAKQAITESKEERARLAQVVMFNNIITSYLTLERKGSDGKSDKMRNVSAWKKEQAALEKANVNDAYFANLKVKDSGSGGKGINANEQIGGEAFIDEILGKKELTAK